MQIRNTKVKYEVKLKNGNNEYVSFPGFSMFSEVNVNGDLTLYKNHYNMLYPMPVATFAAGEWITSRAVYEEE